MGKALYVPTKVQDWFINSIHTVRIMRENGSLFMQQEEVSIMIQSIKYGYGLMLSRKASYYEGRTGEKY